MTHTQHISDHREKTLKQVAWFYVLPEDELSWFWGCEESDPFSMRTLHSVRIILWRDTRWHTMQYVTHESWLADDCVICVWVGWEHSDIIIAGGIHEREVQWGWEGSFPWNLCDLWDSYLWSLYFSVPRQAAFATYIPLCFSRTCILTGFHRSALNASLVR